MIFDIAVGSAIGVTVSSVAILCVRIVIRFFTIGAKRKTYEDQLRQLEKMFAAQSDAKP